jgi:hydantoinase/carbamoylase family amidase
LKINLDRLENDFNYINSISSTSIGCTRLSYSKEDKKVREYIIKELEMLNAQINIDSVGNIRAKFNPNKLNNKYLMIGSHIDTVYQGGKFDGLTGTLCSLEVMRVFNENKEKLNVPLEFVIFAEEEGSNFGVTMIGSKYMTKKITLDDLKNLFTKEKVSAYDYIQQMGFEFHPEKDDFVDKENELAMIELHVEQGGILDKKKMSIGIVETIVGMNTLEVTVKGVSNHAGTTPMDYRKDSLLASAEMIRSLPRLVEDLANAVITVGKIDVKPNSSNVIAAETIFSVDIRDVRQDNIERISERVNEICERIAKEKNVDVKIKLIGSSKPVNMDQDLIRIIEEQVLLSNINYIRMNSGAVHDNAMLNDIIPTAMIFIPSIDGISHSPYEQTKMEDVLIGAEILLNTVNKINRRS